MLKVEIELDEIKLDQNGYSLERAQREIRNYFGKYPKDIKEITTAPKMLVFKGLDTENSWADLMVCIGYFVDNAKWFQGSASKILWYNSDNGRDENDFEIEDVLEHYRKKGIMA